MLVRPVMKRLFHLKAKNGLIIITYPVLHLVYITVHTDLCNILATSLIRM